MIAIIRIIRSIGGHQDSKPLVSFRQSLRNTFVASGASWIPNVIHTAASYLGPLFVFGVNGAVHAGVYFISYSILTAVAAASSVLSSISYPVLSAMRDGRKRFTWQIMRISLIISTPLSSSIFFYSNSVLGIFGESYIPGALSLEILLLSVVPLTIMTGINTLANSYGHYRHVLLIGIANNLPTALLYLILVPVYESIGAGASVTIGSFTGLIMALLVAKKIGLLIFWRYIGLIIIVPTTIAFAVSRFQLNFLIGTLIIFTTSFLILFKLRVITSVDIEDCLNMLPTGVAGPILKFYNKANNRFNRN